LDRVRIDRDFANQEENLDHCDHNQKGYDDDQEQTIHDLIPDMDFRIPGFDSSAEKRIRILLHCVVASLYQTTNGR
jgi:hypothetical protein